MFPSRAVRSLQQVWSTDAHWSFNGTFRRLGFPQEHQLREVLTKAPSALAGTFGVLAGADAEATGMCHSTLEAALVVVR